MTKSPGPAGTTDPGGMPEKRAKAQAVEALRRAGSKVLAATAAQVSLQTLDNWRKLDDDFAHQWDVAIQTYITELRRIPIEERAHYWHCEIPQDIQLYQERALVLLSTGLSLAGVCARLRISVGRFRRWEADNADFKAAAIDAREAGMDFLEDVARGRGVDGVDKPVFYQGEHVANVKEYSDMLLDRLLRSRRSSWRPAFVVPETTDNELTVRWDDSPGSPTPNNPVSGSNTPSAGSKLN